MSSAKLVCSGSGCCCETRAAAAAAHRSIGERQKAEGAGSVLGRRQRGGGGQQISAADGFHRDTSKQGRDVADKDLRFLLKTNF